MKKNYNSNQSYVAHQYSRHAGMSFSIFVAFLLLSLNVSAQTTVFTDDFNRNQNPFGATGGTPEMTWDVVTTGEGPGTFVRTEQNSGSDYRLGIFNGSNSTSSATTRGRTYVQGSLSTFAAPFSSKLSENIHDIIWTMNIRSGRHTSQTAGDNGFDGVDGSYGYAVILGATGSDFLTANGYAVTLRRVPASGNAIRLERFENGLSANANLTTIIGPSDVLTQQNNYFSVKVVYTPSTNTWKLYTRVDGASPLDPDSESLTQVGTGVVDSDLTGATMTHFGFFVNHQTLTWNSGNNKGNFDNFKVVVDNATSNLATIRSVQPAYVANGKLYLVGESVVYNSVGMKVASNNKFNDNIELMLPSGVYLVKTKELTQKVLIP